MENREKMHGININVMRDNDQTKRKTIRKKNPTEKKYKCKLCPFINVHQVQN